MATDNNKTEHPRGDSVPAHKPDLTPAARRALAEAEARRNKQATRPDEPAQELGGREGPDPVRYGDWENGGIVSDF